MLVWVVLWGRGSRGRAGRKDLAPGGAGAGPRGPGPGPARRSLLCPGGLLSGLKGW